MRRPLLLATAGTYILIRCFSLLVVSLASRDQVPVPGWTDDDPGYLDMTVLWDGSWYREAAINGYPRVLPLDEAGQVGENAWAFYPLFPAMARTVMALTGLEFPFVASGLAFLAGLVAALLMVVLLAERVGGSGALAAVAVWAAFPASPTLQLAYTESIATVLLCAFLLLLSRREWWYAGVVALVMGFTRPIAVPLAAVLAVALLLRWRRRDAEPLTQSEVVRAVLGLWLAAAAGFVWPTIAWVVTGSRTAYTDTMAAWREGHEVVPFAPWFETARWVFQDTDHPEGYAVLLLVAIPAVLVAAVAGPWARRLGSDLRTWCIAYPAYLAAVLDPFTSIFRYLIPLFPLAAVAVGVAGTPRRPLSPTAYRARTAAIAGVLVAGGLVGQVYWVRELLVFVPPADYPP